MSPLGPNRLISFKSGESLTLSQPLDDETHVVACGKLLAIRELVRIAVPKAELLNLCPS